MPPRSHNRFIVLSTDEPDEGLHTDSDDDRLPPSDPPDPLSDDNTDGTTTPIHFPNAALPRTSFNFTSSSPTPSSPLQARTSRLYRRHASPRSSSLPPRDVPQFEHAPEPVLASDDSVMFTPRTERRVINERVQGKHRATVQSLQLGKAVEAAAGAARLRIEDDEKVRTRDQLFASFLDDMQSRNISLAEFLDHVFNPDNKFAADWRWKGFFSHQSLVERIFGYWTTSKYNQTTRTFVLDWATALVAKTVYSEARSVTLSWLLSKSKKVVNEQFFLDFSLAGLTTSLRGLAPTAFRVFDVFSTTKRQEAHAFMRKKELMKGCAALTLLCGASQHNGYAQAVMSTYLAATGGQRQHYSVLSLYGFAMGYSSVISKTFAPKVDEKEPSHADAGDTAGDAADSEDEYWVDEDAEGPAATVSPSPGLANARKKQTRSKNKKKPKRVRGPGILPVLCDACMSTNRSIAATRLTLLVYDNLNLMARIAEQILGRKSAQENGTCATLLQLINAKIEDLETGKLDASILAARPLTIDDISLTDAEGDFFSDNMVHTIERIIVLHGGEGFVKWKKDVDASQPVSADTIPVHKTPIHPLPTMEIDESTITGNVQVIEEVMRVLGFKPDDPDYGKYVQLVAGDQLTIARQCSILNVRLGHESGHRSWKNIVLIPGLFHAKIADCHGLLTIHFGEANVRSPGSLGFHNTVLDRLPITLTSLPPFRTCHDLIMVSLYSRILHCLLLVSGKDSLQACADSIDSYETLVNYAKEIYTTYTDVEHVQQLREQRIPEERQRDAKAKAEKKVSGASDSTPLPHIRKGDMVFENALLFLRDALLSREFSDAIKAGDSGRVLIIIKQWAFCYRGNGRTKYAHEMLHVLHNLTCAWTKELRNIVLQNWLANPQGKANSFVEIDLVQEHLNFWIKKIYKADGDGHSWDWLALISPCVDILRQLATKINTELGARQGSKHATPDLKEDIDELMKSLAEHEVYVEKEGRVLDDDEKPAPDVLSVGMAALTHGASITPLEEFNQQFETLRQRRRLTPVADLLPLISTSVDENTVTTGPTLSTLPAVEEDDSSELPDLIAPADSDDEDDAEELDEDLFADSPTLTRLDEGDVEFDMDNVPEWYLDDGDHSDSDSDYEDV